MQSGDNPVVFNAQRGVSFLPRNRSVGGFRAFQEEERKIKRAREDEQLSSGERFERMKHRRDH